MKYLHVKIYRVWSLVGNGGASCSNNGSRSRRMTTIGYIVLCLELFADALRLLASNECKRLLPDGGTWRFSWISASGSPLNTSITRDSNKAMTICIGGIWDAVNRHRHCVVHVSGELCITRFERECNQRSVSDDRGRRVRWLMSINALFLCTSAPMRRQKYNNKKEL